MSLGLLSRLWPPNGTAQVCWQCLTNHLSCTCSRWTGAFVWAGAPSSMSAVCSAAREISSPRCIHFTGLSMTVCPPPSSCCWNLSFEKGRVDLSQSNTLHTTMGVKASFAYLIFPPEFSSLKRNFNIHSKVTLDDSIFLSWLFVLTLEPPHSLIYIFYSSVKYFLLKYHTFRSLLIDT